MIFLEQTSNVYFKGHTFSLFKTYFTYEREQAETAVYKSGIPIAKAAEARNLLPTHTPIFKHLTALT